MENGNCTLFYCCVLTAVHICHGKGWSCICQVIADSFGRGGWGRWEKKKERSGL